MNHEADMVDDRDAGVTFGQAANFEHGELDTVWNAAVPGIWRERSYKRNRTSTGRITVVIRGHSRPCQGAFNR
jgi:hypothetical protein